MTNIKVYENTLRYKLNSYTHSLKAGPVLDALYVLSYWSSKFCRAKGTFPIKKKKSLIVCSYFTRSG